MSICYHFRPITIRRALTSAVAVIAVATGSATITGCGGSAAPGTQQPFVVDIGKQLQSLDPSEVVNSVDAGVVNTLYSELVTYGTQPGPDGSRTFDTRKIEPYLAKSWTVSKDFRTYTFKLRPNMKFPNGDPVDSAAVKYSFERTIAMGSAPAFFLQEGFPGVLHITTPNPTTVVFHLSRSLPTYLEILTQWGAAVMDPSVIRAHGGVKANSINTWMETHSAGYGPYVIQSYTPGKSLALTANPGFFAPPKSKKMIINFFTSDAPLLLEARSGQSDVTIDMSPQAVHSLIGSSCCHVMVNQASGHVKIALPGKKPPYNNVLFREALNYATPDQSIFKDVAYGVGKPYYGPWPPTFGIQELNPAWEQPIPYDLAKAKELIKESGVKLPVAITLLTTEGSTTDADIATVIQGAWKRIGVNVAVQTVTTAEDLQDVYTTHQHASMYEDGFSADPAYIWGYDMTCTSANDSDQWCSPEGAKLETKLLSTPPAQRGPIMEKMIALWRSQYPRVVLYAKYDETVLSSKMSPSNYVYYVEGQMRFWSLSH